MNQIIEEEKNVGTIKIQYLLLFKKNQKQKPAKIFFVRFVTVVNMFSNKITPNHPEHFPLACCIKTRPASLVHVLARARPRVFVCVLSLYFPQTLYISLL